jgi:hypothetical protein
MSKREQYIPHSFIHIYIFRNISPHHPTKQYLPSSKIGTTVWSKYARIGIDWTSGVGATVAAGAGGATTAGAGAGADSVLTAGTGSC